MLRQILPIDHPMLQQRSEPIDLSDGVPEEIARLAHDMLQTSNAVGGAGMAAVQVGVPIRMFVMDLSSVAGPIMVFLNPRIVETSEEQATRLEGCLSMPGVSTAIERPARVVVEYTNLSGQAKTYEATEFAAQCVQHEMDHLAGVTMLDIVSPLKRKMLKTQFEKAKRRERKERR